jgi:hypothetical protein
LGGLEPALSLFRGRRSARRFLQMLLAARNAV